MGWEPLIGQCHASEVNDGPGPENSGPLSLEVVRTSLLQDTLGHAQRLGDQVFGQDPAQGVAYQVHGIPMVALGGGDRLQPGQEPLPDHSQTLHPPALENLRDGTLAGE